MTGSIRWIFSALWWLRGVYMSVKQRWVTIVACTQLHQKCSGFQVIFAHFVNRRTWWAVEENFKFMHDSFLRRCCVKGMLTLFSCVGIEGKTAMWIIFQKHKYSIIIHSLIVDWKILTPFTPLRVTCWKTCSDKCNEALLTKKED